jgi:hypothetical protein
MAYKAAYKNEAFIGDVVTRTRPLSDGAAGTVTNVFVQQNMPRRPAIEIGHGRTRT